MQDYASLYVGAKEEVDRLNKVLAALRKPIDRTVERTQNSPALLHEPATDGKIDGNLHLVLSQTRSQRTCPLIQSTATQGSLVQLKMDRYAPRAPSGRHTESMHDYFCPRASCDTGRCVGVRAAAQTASFGTCAHAPCRRGFACPYLRRRCCFFFGHSPEEVAAESEVGRDHPVPCRDDAATAQNELMKRGATTGTSRGADRGCPSAPDQGGRFAACTTGTRGKSRSGASRGCASASDQKDGLQLVPQERVQKSPDVHGESLTVKMRHHREDQAYAVDTGFHQGSRQHNIPRSGDVMVPVLHIQEQIVPRRGSTTPRGWDLGVGRQGLFPRTGFKSASQSRLRRSARFCLRTRLSGDLSWEALDAGLPPAALLELQEAPEKAPGAERLRGGG